MPAALRFRHAPRLRAARRLAILAGAVLAGNAAESLVVSIAAGPHERVQTLVDVALPADLARGPWTLVADDGQRLALQVDDQHHGFVRILHLAADATLTGHLAGVATAAPTVTWQRAGDVLAAHAGAQRLLRYIGGAGNLPPGVKEVYQRGGYLTDVITAAGVTVTDDYPPNHLHHHGIWMAWAKTSFAGRNPDFWNMGERTGTVQALAIDGTWDGPWCAGFHARHRYLDLGVTPAVAALEERWDVMVSAPVADAPPAIDLTATQSCSGAQPLVLTPFHYGGLGLRGNRAWNAPDGTARFLTSAGKDRANGDETRARWCWMGGEVDGRTVGMVVCDHPANPRHPTPLRLNPKEPFLACAPSQLGEWSIQPGTPLVLRYRILAWDGAPDPARFDRLWDDFAEPPTATVAVTSPGK
jgi:hypothetical protein